MFLTVHTAVGALIGQQVGSPILAFVLGFISHWLVDVVPHGDENFFADNLEKKVLRKRLLTLASFDFLGIAIMFLFFSSTTDFTTPMLFGFLGATGPDLLWGITEIAPFKTPWGLLDKWHSFFHKLTGVIVSIKTGLLIQIITLILTIIAIVR